MKKCDGVARPKLALVVNKTVGFKTGALPTAWESAVAGWLTWMRLRGMRPTTMRTRRGQVGFIATRSQTMHPRDVTFALLMTLCDQPDWSNDHRKGVRSALIGFFDYCLDRALVDENPARLLPKVADSKPRPRPVTDSIWNELIAKADARERMMARLACEAGMRRAEVAVCHRDDLVEQLDGWSLIVHGKGGKQRVVPITPRLAQEICAYCDSGFLFPGKIDGHISAEYAGVLISRLMPPGWSMHKLRHRYASKGYAGTHNLRAVQEALGHQSVATTQRYTAVSARDVRAVSEAASNVMVLRTPYHQSPEAV